MPAIDLPFNDLADWLNSLQHIDQTVSREEWTYNVPITLPNSTNVNPLAIGQVSETIILPYLPWNWVEANIFITNSIGGNSGFASLDLFYGGGTSGHSDMLLTYSANPAHVVVEDNYNAVLTLANLSTLITPPANSTWIIGGIVKFGYMRTSKEVPFKSIFSGS